MANIPFSTKLYVKKLDTGYGCTNPRSSLNSVVSATVADSFPC